MSWSSQTSWHLSFHTSDSGWQRKSEDNQLRQRHGAISLLQTCHWAERQHPSFCPLQRLVHQHSSGEQQAGGNVPGECPALPNLHHPGPEKGFHMWASSLILIQRKFGFWKECKIYCISYIFYSKKKSAKIFMYFLKHYHFARTTSARFTEGLFTVCTKYRKWNNKCIDIVKYQHKMASLCCLVITLCIYCAEWWYSVNAFIY